MLRIREAIRPCLPLAEARMIEKTRNRLCRESSLQATIMARINVASRQRQNSPPVSTLAAPDDESWTWLAEMEGERALTWVRGTNAATRRCPDYACPAQSCATMCAECPKSCKMQ